MFEIMQHMVACIDVISAGGAYRSVWHPANRPTDRRRMRCREWHGLSAEVSVPTQACMDGVHY